MARRAFITLRSARTEKAPAIAMTVGLSENTVRNWFCRLIADGTEGSARFPLSARPRACSEVERGNVVPSALPPAEKLDIRCCHWTLDLLEPWNSTAAKTRTAAIAHATACWDDHRRPDTWTKAA